MREISPYFIRRDFTPNDAPPVRNAPGFFEEKSPTLREWWHVVRGHLRLIAAVFGAAMALTAVVVFTMTPTYTAETTILIERQAPQILNARDMMAEAPDSDEHDYYETQYKLLESRSLAERVVRELDLERNPLFAQKASDGLVAEAWDGMHSALSLFWSSVVEPAPKSAENSTTSEAAVIDAYLKRLVVKPELGTRLVVIGFGTPNAALSAKIANAHVHAYIRHGMELHAQASENARDFLEKKLVELRERVEKSEAALNAYRRERGIVTFSTESKGKIVMQRLTDLNTELTKVESERIALEAQVDRIDKGDYQSVPAVMSSDLIQKLKIEVDDLSSQYAQMRNRFKPDYHPLADLGAKVDDAQNRLAEETHRTIEGVKTDYRAASGREDRLKRQIAEVKTEALALNDASLQDAVLARDVDSNHELYKSVLERMKEIGVSAEVPTSNVSLVDPAMPPRQPSSPKLFMSFLVSALLSLLGGIAGAFLLDHLDDRLKKPEDVEQFLHLPSLGMVPDFVALNTPAYAGTYLPKSEQAENGEKYYGREMVSARSRFSAAAEVYRTIRTAILYSRAGSPPKTVLVTSGGSGEGKTVTAINTAIAFAQMGEKILLIDTDMRRSRCHEVLGIQNHLGLAEVLAGQKEIGDVVRPTRVEGLYLLSAGATPPNPSELLASTRMRDVLGALASEYARIVLDSAPVMPVTDTVILSTMADGVLVVVGQDTPKQVARYACRRLHDVGAKVLGVVLNQVDFRHPGYYTYSRYQSYGYRRGQDQAA